jgi:hypothetical protein
MTPQKISDFSAIFDVALKCWSYGTVPIAPIALLICSVIIKRFLNFLHHNSVISNGGEWKINNLLTHYKCHTGIPTNPYWRPTYNFGLYCQRNLGSRPCTFKIYSREKSWGMTCLWTTFGKISRISVHWCHEFSSGSVA